MARGADAWAQGYHHYESILCSCFGIVSAQGALALPNCPKWCKIVGNMCGSIFFSIGYKRAVYNEYLTAAAQYDKYKYLYEYTENPNENLVDFINELEQILPSSFYTNSFSSDLDGISMSVTVEGKEAAARTILNIRNMKSISDVQISNITDSKNELGESAVTFSITGTYADIHAETEETEAAGDTAGTTAQ